MAGGEEKLSLDISRMIVLPTVGGLGSEIVAWFPLMRPKTPPLWTIFMPPVAVVNDTGDEAAPPPEAADPTPTPA